MTRWVASAEELPSGSHALALYSSKPEAARTMASFLQGAQNRDQSAIVFSDDEEQLSLYRSETARALPQFPDVFRRIDGPHTHATPEGLRPPLAVDEFAAAHPEGVSMCGDTIPRYLDRQNLAQYLEYERWFDTQRPFLHRGLCPYDVAALPVDVASRALLALARAHTHAVLSNDPNPGVRLLQLLLTPQLENAPREMAIWLDRAADLGLVEFGVSGETVTLTLQGEQFARALLARRS